MAERDMEEVLQDAGNALLQAPASPDVLLPQLDQVAKLLEKVDQSPSKPMLDALSPIIKAMVEEKLLRNQDEDVRVAVGSCISEITRITAPDAPYDDNQMKEVFQLIVSTFENLADRSSHSYSKRAEILETVAKVRSCVVMLDLECDDLIVQMFQHFLKAIRDHHPENVFSNMETIMILVLEESEEIGFEIMSPLLSSLKKDNEDVQPIARKLAENVIKQCAEKVKPCLLEARSSMNISFDDYSPIISTICMGMNHVGDENHNAAGEQPFERMANGASSAVTSQVNKTKLAVASSDEAPQDQLTKESEADIADGQGPHASVESGPGEDNSVPLETGSEEDHPVPVVTAPGEEIPVAMDLGPVEEELHAPATPPKSATSNGVAETENEDIAAGPCSENHHQQTIEEDQLCGDDERGNAAPVDSDSAKVVAEVQPKSAKNTNKRSKRTKRSMKLKVPSESSSTDADTDKETKLDTEARASPSRDPSAEMDVDEENEKETELSPEKAVESQPANVLSPSPSGSKRNESRSSLKKGGKSKQKKNRFSKKALSSKGAATMKAAGVTNKSELKPVVGQSDKKAPVKDSCVEKAQVLPEPSEDEGGSGSDSDAKLVKRSTKKADTRAYAGDGSSSRKKGDDKKSVRGKTTVDKETASSPKSSKTVKDDGPLKETPKTSSKRKRTPTTGKAIDVKKLGEDLVGAKIKVWWPMDKMFYEGVVNSYDAKSKKHEVNYTDGENERLNLEEERWEKIEEGDSREDGEQDTEAGSPETNPEMQKKKKAKAGPEPSGKKGKAESSRDGLVSSSKSKGAAKKSGGKSVDKRKDVKLADVVTPKTSAVKSEDAGSKSKARSKKAAGGKSTGGESSRKVAKSPETASEDSENDDLRDSIKSSSKGNASRSGGKSSIKVKSGSAKSKLMEEKEKSPELVKSSKSGKGKLAATPKGKGTERKSDTPKGGKETEGKSGKKRRRA